jgi:hypothetical protein
VVGWCILGKNINEKLKEIFLTSTKIWKGWSKKTKKFNILSIKIQVAKLFLSAHPNRCGFCGGLECTVGLQPYGYGANKRFNIVSECDYFWDFIKTKNMSNINPCQNIPTSCSECKTLVWSYNMKEHYRISHPKIKTVLMK